MRARPAECLPFDTLWTDRPAAPAGQIREMPEISGESSADKRQRVAAILNGKRLTTWRLPCRIISPGC
jgi:hypothetical protein